MKTMTKEEFNEVGPFEKGPQTEHTMKAHTLVEEFIESGADACEIEWEKVSEDYDKAKSVIANRITYSRYEHQGDGKAEDIGLRSNREKGKIYLIHKERI